MAMSGSSRRRMKRAEKFAQDLNGAWGDALKAVFVTGSVAHGKAGLLSDLDMVVVFNEKRVSEKQAADYAGLGKKLSRKQEINIQLVREKVFCNPKEFRSIDFMTSAAAWESEICAARQLCLDGAVPVFGKEFAQNHKQSWRPPSKAMGHLRYENIFFAKRRSARIKARVKDAFSKIGRFFRRK